MVDSAPAPHIVFPRSCASHKFVTRTLDKYATREADLSDTAQVPLKPEHLQQRVAQAHDIVNTHLLLVLVGRIKFCRQFGKFSLQLCDLFLHHFQAGAERCVDR